MTAAPSPESRARLAACLLVPIALACTSRMDVSVVRYPAADQVAVRGPHCGPEHIETDEAEARGCLEIGETSVTDVGNSWRCERERVHADIDSVACSLGADAVVITPLPGTGCYQARGLLLSCASAAPSTP